MTFRHIIFALATIGASTSMAQAKQVPVKAAKETGFHLDRLPQGKNVTIPRPATTFVPLSSSVNLTATDIFREPAWIREAVETLRSRPELESVFSGHKTHKNFWERQEDGTWLRVRPWMAVYSSRQVRRPVVREDTGLACASRARLWREGRRIGDRVEIIVNDDAFTGIDIHEDEDLQLAEAALRIRGG